MRARALILGLVVVALAAAPAPAQQPPPAGPAAPPAPGERGAPQLTPQQRLLLFQEQQKTLNRKFDFLHKRIQEVNKRLAAQAVAEDYEEKREAELQLLDLITTWALIERAQEQMERIGREIAQLRGDRGAPDLGRRQLLNFLRARKEDYIRFAVR